MEDRLSAKTISLLNNVQYFLSSVVAVSFGIGLIPTLYDDVFKVIMFVLTVQIVISLFRLRLLNVFFEIFLIGTGVLAYVPLLGYFFRVIGIFVSILELASFKNSMLYKQMEIRTFRTGKKRRGKNAGAKVSTKKTPVKFKDAEFSEKKK